MSTKEVIATSSASLTNDSPAPQNFYSDKSSLLDALGATAERSLLGRTTLGFLQADRILTETNTDLLNNSGVVRWTNKRIIERQLYVGGAGLHIPSIDTVSLYWNTRLPGGEGLNDEIKYRLAIAVIDAKKVFWYLKESTIGEFTTDEELYDLGEDLPEGGALYIDSSLSGIYDMVAPIISRGVIPVMNPVIKEVGEWVEQGVEDDINFLISAGKL